LNIISSSTLKIFGTLFILMGLSSMFFSAYIYLNPLKEVKDESLVKIEKLRICTQTAKEAGFIAEGNAKKELVNIKLNDLGEWKNELSASSFIMKGCTGLDLEYFCMGRSCKDIDGKPAYGIVMTMKYKKPKILD
jgi:hypothetical protein